MSSKPTTQSTLCQPQSVATWISSTTLPSRQNRILSLSFRTLYANVSSQTHPKKPPMIQAFKNAKLQLHSRPSVQLTLTPLLLMEQRRPPMRPTPSTNVGTPSLSKVLGHKLPTRARKLFQKSNICGVQCWERSRRMGRSSKFGVLNAGRHIAVNVGTGVTDLDIIARKRSKAF